MNYNEFFSNCYVINLKRRPERLQSFYAQLSEQNIELAITAFEAIDGNNIVVPSWWGVGKPAFACYQSHLSIIQMALSNKFKNVLIFEDDAMFMDNFVEKLNTCISELPNDWDFFYLGGQHLKESNNPTYLVTDHLSNGYNVNRLHAYAINAKALPDVYTHLHEYKIWERSHHIDHHLGKLHERTSTKVYCAHPWIVGQGQGKSDICGKDCGMRLWDTTRINKSSIINDNVDLKYATAGYGTVGLNGELGYNDAKVDISYNTDDKIDYISAHAPSRLVLSVKKPVKVFAALNNNARPKYNVIFKLNNNFVSNLNFNITITTPVLLPIGTHVIEFKPDGNNSNANMQTVLGIINEL